MERHENYGVPFYTAENLQLPGIRHAFSCRQGGVSKDHCASMNFGSQCGDDIENVRENFRRFCQAVGIDLAHVVLSDQKHTTAIRKVTPEDWGKGPLRPRDYHDIDGLLTNDPQTALFIVSADCTPVLYADPVQKVVGAAHAGWQGTLHGIAGDMIARMVTDFGCDPAHIQVAMGPHIGYCCYEVGQEVYDQFAGHPLLQGQPCLKITPEGRYYIDLGGCNQRFLEAQGVPRANIYDSKLCTLCHNDIFFSHRGGKGKKGLLGAIIQLD